MTRNSSIVFLNLIVAGIVLIGCSRNVKEKQSNDYSTFKNDHKEWDEYLGGSDRNHYSTLNQITKDNVTQLEVAWVYESSDTGQMQMNAIVVDSILYGISSKLTVFALNARTGKEIWTYGDSTRNGKNTSRGVSYWSNGADKRIFFTIADQLLALDALTGKLKDEFGNQGRVDLHTGLPKSAENKFITSTTPGVIFENTIIMPVRVSEGAGSAPGDIRAFDVRSGKLVWTFHTIPFRGQEGYDTWKDLDDFRDTQIGGVNNWAGMALDKKSSMLFVPTGSAAPDFYGVNRLGDNLFSNCLLALNAQNGELVWYYQIVHHDLWDRDLPAPPNLLTVQKNGKSIEAVAQITKHGYVYLFERKSGKPLFEIKEIDVPSSNIPGEIASKTQPVPVLPKPFARQVSELTQNNYSPYLSDNDKGLIEKLEKYIKVPFQPPGLYPVILLPGYDGGAEWGGAGADPNDGIIYVNSNEMAWELKLEKVEGDTILTGGEQLYVQNCAVCHQKDKSGLPNSGVPSLNNSVNELDRNQIYYTISTGKGMMPGFPQLGDKEKNAIVDYLFNIEKKEVVDQFDKNQVPYRHTGYKKLLDSKGLPVISPPWGTFHAINLNNGKYLWSIPLGVTNIGGKEKNTGTENYGGPAVTENGLLFIAATKDGYFRVFDRHSGELLWQTKLPYPSFATPTIYEVKGEQFIVLACGGGKLGTPEGNLVVAYSLPKDIKTSNK